MIKNNGQVKYIEFDEKITEQILESMSNIAAKTADYTIQNGAAKRLSECLNRLMKLYTNEKQEIIGKTNSLTHYNKKQGWSNFIYEPYELNDEETYQEILHICVEILDIIRTGGMENPLQLVVYSLSENNKSNIASIYIANEKDLANLKYVHREYENNIIDQIEYIKSRAEMEVKKMKKGEYIFAKHYASFRNAIEKRKELKKIKKRIEDNSITEGHIIEAYQRHLYFQHNIKRMSLETIENFNQDERISTKWLAINLYYSINSAGWWTGGDVGSMQLKAGNSKLATIMSIKAVASTLLEMTTNNKFDAKKFKKLFVQEGLNNKIRKDPERMANKKIDELLDIIGNKAEILKQEREKIFDN